METVADFIFLGSKITVDSDCSQESKRHFLLRSTVMTKLDSVLKSRDNTLLTKVHNSQSYGFSSGHVPMGELDHKGWAPKNWCFWIVVIEKNVENPLDCKEIKAVNPKGNQPWTLAERTDTKAEAPILWPPDEKSRLTAKDPDPGKDWGQKEKRATEDEMVGWHHWLQLVMPSNSMSLSKLREIVKNREDWRAAVHGVAKNQTQLSNWTTIFPSNRTKVLIFPILL